MQFYACKFTTHTPFMRHLGRTEIPLKLCLVLYHKTKRFDIVFARFAFGQLQIKRLFRPSLPPSPPGSSSLPNPSSAAFFLNRSHQIDKIRASSSLRPGDSPRAAGRAMGAERIVLHAADHSRADRSELHGADARRQVLAALDIGQAEPASRA